MTPIGEMLNAVPGINLTPEVTNALAASRVYDMANAMLPVPVLKRAAANTHGEAITPQIDAAIAVAALAGPLATHHVGQPSPCCPA
jgi:hypothetical protein